METVFVALRVLLSLAVVLGLLWWLQRRLTRGPRATRVNPITVVTRQSISPKASVVMIEVDGQRLVLGVTEHAITVLQASEAISVENPAPAASPATAFAVSLDAATSTATPATPTLVPALSPVPPLAAAAVTAVPALPVTAMPATPLAGSILSLHTWKQAAATLRRAW